ncbi:hypothetical protein AB3Y40_05470 [Yoonia sp. R2331]|uniref:hypothetical protein n=1 Tax=Yoonia sp. R2331 TaxID=3237238 RepID=UPI0034E5DF5F
MHGYWIVQAHPKTKFDRGLGTTTSWFFSLDDALTSIRYGHSTLYLKNEKLRDLGVSSDLEDWKEIDISCGALEDVI